MAAIDEWKAAAPPATAAPAVASAASDASRESLALAKRYDQLVTKIDGLGLISPELSPLAERYQKLSREAALALRDVATAVEQGDAVKARQRRVAFEDIALGEGPLVGEINAVCR